eukprot:gene4007-5475_t
MSTFFVVMTVATYKRTDIYSLDIPVAYLNSDEFETPQDEKIMMRIDAKTVKILLILMPDLAIFVRKDGTIWVYADKAIYGLKQAAKCWRETLEKFLKGLGYKPCMKDECLFIKTVGKSFCLLLVHVDDIVFTSNDVEMVNELKAALTEKFKVQTYAKNNFSYLNMSVNVEGDLIKINQIGYIKEYFNKYKLDKVDNRVTTPSDKELFNIDQTAQPAKDSELFRKKVMTLMYLAKLSRYDILKEVVFLSTRCNVCTTEDEKKLKRLETYIFNTKELELTIRPKDLIITAYADASYGVHPDRKGHTGIIICLGGVPVKVRSNKQRLVTRSSTESELIALDECLVDVLWIRQLLEEIGIKQDVSTEIFQDNKSTIII